MGKFSLSTLYIYRVNSELHYVENTHTARPRICTIVREIWRVIKLRPNHTISLMFSVRTHFTLRYDTGIIRVFYAHAIVNFTPPNFTPKFYGPPPEIRSQTRSMNYPEMPCEWSIAGEYRGCSSL